MTKNLEKSDRFFSERPEGLEPFAHKFEEFPHKAQFNGPITKTHDTKRQDSIQGGSVSKAKVKIQIEKYNGRGADIQGNMILNKGGRGAL